jgi:hypothetical protein
VFNNRKRVNFLVVLHLREIKKKMTLMKILNKTSNRIALRKNQAVTLNMTQKMISRRSIQRAKTQVSHLHLREEKFVKIKRKLL